ncbi:DUF5818 domain-containing protein [Novosphingobium subterraneum]|nr:DUF5818 domain-containing protein [Novosphingobium subterraneum]
MPTERSVFTRGHGGLVGMDVVRKHPLARQESIVTRRLRASGILLESRRGWLLKTDDEAVWVLDHEHEQDFAANLRVIVEGQIFGLDRLRVDWIGPQEKVC